MAKRTKSEPKSEMGAATPRDRIIDALMALAAERHWDEIDLPAIAAQAEVSLADLRDHFPSKGAILGAFAKRIDRIVLDEPADEMADEPADQRLFDVMMRRLDALTPYRDALRRIAKGLMGDPLALAAMNGVMLNSMRFMLAAAGIDTEDRLGALRVQGAVLIFARVQRVWFHDDDPGLARTMAKLDRELQSAGRTMRMVENADRLSAPFRGIARRVLCGVADLGSRRRMRDRDHDDRVNV
jgi:AcrR family transcriptional regulator